MRNKFRSDVVDIDISKRICTFLVGLEIGSANGSKFGGAD